MYQFILIDFYCHRTILFHNCAIIYILFYIAAQVDENSYCQSE